MTTYRLQYLCHSGMWWMSYSLAEFTDKLGAMSVAHDLMELRFDDRDYSVEQWRIVDSHGEYHPICAAVKNLYNNANT